jgi:acetyltransferase-like isoleucine patch superfamily enzyme
VRGNLAPFSVNAGSPTRVIGMRRVEPHRVAG